MSAKKATRKPKAAPSPPVRQFLSRLLAGRRQTVALGVVVAGLAVGSWYMLWKGVRDHVLSSKQYWLTPDRVEVSPLPPWIHTDIRTEVFRDAGLDRPLSIMDDNLVSRLADAFSLHPWVARVRRVSKHHPAEVRVVLDYRRPVCMIQISGGLLPVDAEGVVLPSGDFSPVEASRYPRLVGTETVPLGPVGTRWGDPRVVGAARIADAFGADWQTLGLDRIVARGPMGPGQSDRHLYEILTRGGTRILWGAAPGDATIDEGSAAEKVAWLKQYAREQGTLDEPNPREPIDLRSLRLPGPSPQTAGAAGSSRHR